ncbi:AAA family ATPase [Beijerinckia mobilis]|uniref:AAA family ATPase n=1 Tax=Beijerinckia mobilis TaxID=231434 RepID=UPI00068CA8C9|nr:AAA family ATPase [Beijerinckia mobilis]
MARLDPPFDPEDALATDPPGFRRKDWSEYDPGFRSGADDGYVPPGEKDGASPQRFKLIPFNEIQPITTPGYLIKGVVPRVGLMIVWGEPKCGKSFLVLDLVMHIALGWEYRGRKVRQGTVVYMALEGEAGFNNRIAAFRQEHLVGYSGLVPFYLIASHMSLVPDHVALIASIKAALGDEAPAAIVIDTLNRSITGSESSDEDMGAYIKAADVIRETFNCAVIIVHHCGWDKTRPRGHSSLGGAIETQISVKKDETNTVITEVELMKDDEAGAIFSSRMRRVEIGENEEGDPITSLIVEPIEDNGEPANIVTTTAPGILQRNLLKLYDMLASDVESSPGFDGKPVLKVSVEDLRDKLKSRGFLEVNEKGQITATDRKNLTRAKTELIERRILVEEDGKIWRI